LYFYDYPFNYDGYGTLSSSASIGATSISVTPTAFVTCGNYIRVGRNTANDEFVRLATSGCGSGTPTLGLATPLTFGHASGEKFDRAWSTNYLTTGSAYFGGQGHYVNKGSYGPWAGVPDLIATKQTSDYTYALSQLTGAYDQSAGAINATNRTLRSYYRTFVWIGDGYFVVKDRAISKAARAGVSTYDKLLFWHLSPNTTPSWTDPVVSGSRVTSATVGTSKLVVDTLLPANPVLTIRKTDAVPDNGGTPLAQINTGRADSILFAATPTTPLMYRLEVRDPNPSDTFEALTVLSALSSTASAPTVSSIDIISATHAGAYIDDATPRIVVLPRDDSRTYSSVMFQKSWQGTGRVLLAGLAAGRYRIVQNGATLGQAITVSADGVLYFEAAGGGEFRIATELVITTTVLPAARFGTAYSQPLAATGGSGGYTWTVVGGALPAGLALTAGGMIAGTPSVGGWVLFTVQCASGDGQTAVQSLWLNVSGTGTGLQNATASGIVIQ
jgi:hypothetical protein